MGGFAMSISETLLVTGIMLTVAAVLLGHPCWVLAVSLKLVVVAMISTVGT
jgi:hypothetical protein